MLDAFDLARSTHRPFTFKGPWPPPDVLRTPEERFDGLEAVGYAFDPHYIQVGGLRVHYVDEGNSKSKNDGDHGEDMGSEQETFLFLHGYAQTRTYLGVYDRVWSDSYPSFHHLQ